MVTVRKRHKGKGKEVFGKTTVRGIHLEICYKVDEIVIQGEKIKEVFRMRTLDGVPRREDSPTARSSDKAIEKVASIILLNYIGYNVTNVCEAIFRDNSHITKIKIKKMLYAIKVTVDGHCNVDNIFSDILNIYTEVRLGIMANLIHTNGLSQGFAIGVSYGNPFIVPT